MNGIINLSNQAFEKAKEIYDKTGSYEILLDIQLMERKKKNGSRIINSNDPVWAVVQKYALIALQEELDIIEEKLKKS